MCNRLVATVIFQLAILVSLPSSGQISFSYQSAYRYMKGSEASLLTSVWKLPAYSDIAWKQGIAPFRFGDGVLGTELTDMAGNYTTLYIRSSFTCANASLIEKVSFIIDYDDGFVLWVNGTEVLRKNAPSTLVPTSVATANHESGTGEEYLIDPALFSLHDGVNTIAVMALNVSLSSTDFYFDMAVEAEKMLPVYPVPLPVTFSAPSGFYEAPFLLEMTIPDTSARILYTLDGTNPRNSATAITAKSPCSVLIDPSSQAGRDLTPAVILRACSFMPGYNSSFPVTRTFIFTENVKSQSSPGGTWPSADINGQLIDLEMDKDITGSTLWSGQVGPSLKSLPVISIITSNDNLFGPANGIYVNAEGHGVNWERECSVELLDPSGGEGFAINAGIRIRGGYSRHDGYPKHAFRLYFREKYGDSKLEFPLFGEEGVSEFDKMDIRAEQNYGWNNGSKNNSFVREVFSRDLQRDMGFPYTRSRYYNLFLNGMYWGIYMTQERSEANYAESYFGDDEEDYDVVKVNTENYSYSVEATDGNLLSWQKLWNLCKTGFEPDSNYFRLEGKDKYGNPAKGGEVMVDIDNLIGYMMVIFYTGDFDAPTSSFSKNKGSNNFFAIDNRSDRSKGFTFYAHDSEHSLFDEPHSPGIGINEDRVNLGTRNDDYRMDLTTSTKFHPQWLHFKLTANEEYRMRFGDMAYNLLEPTGALSQAENLKRINKRINEVSGAIVAESARWGDAKRTGAPYTKNDWLTEVNKIRNNFIPARNSILISQLKSAGLYPEVSAPGIKLNGTAVDSVIKKTKPVARLEISNRETGGTIVYSINGQDPRRPGGGISSTALFSANPVIMNLNSSQVIKTRIYKDGRWSALKEVSILMRQTDFTDLKITEIHYHPPDLVVGSDTTFGKDLEFIEFKNTGKTAINLSGLTIDSAVQYCFPSNALLPPGQFFVIASKPSRFYEMYGRIASGNFAGNLSNSGEEILLKDNSGKEIIRMTYSDGSPWPSKPDGDGYSLAASEINPDGDPGSFAYWDHSVQTGGNPFADNTKNSENEGNASKPGILVVFPNPGSGLFQVRYDSEEMPENIDVALTDLSGNVIYRGTITNPGILNLLGLHLDPGVYFLVTAGDNGLSTAKIIII